MTNQNEITAQGRVSAMIVDGVFHGDMCDKVREFFNCSEVEIDDAGNIWIESPQRGHWLSTEHVTEFADWVAVQ